MLHSRAWVTNLEAPKGAGRHDANEKRTYEPTRHVTLVTQIRSVLAHRFAGHLAVLIGSNPRQRGNTSRYAFFVLRSVRGSQLGSEAKKTRVRLNHDLTLFVFATNGFASFDRSRPNFASGLWRSLENRKTGRRFVSSVKSQQQESPTRMLPVELLRVRIHGPCPVRFKP